MEREGEFNSPLKPLSKMGKQSQQKVCAKQIPRPKETLSYENSNDFAVLAERFPIFKQDFSSRNLFFVILSLGFSKKV